MADVNYISPSSLMPNAGPVMSPGLSGAFLANQERDYRDTMDLQKFLSGVGAQRAQISLEELIRDLPKKEAERIRDTQRAGLDTQYDPERAALDIQGKRRQDTFDTAIQPSKIASTISGNEKTVNTNNLETINSRLGHVIAMRDLLEDDDPSSLARVLSHAESVGMKKTDPVYQHLAKSGTPATLRDRLSAMEKSLHTQKDSVWASVYGKDLATEVQQAKNEMLERLGLGKLLSQERNVDATNASRERIAAQRAQSEAVKLSMQQTKMNIEQRIVALQAQGTPEAIKQAEELAAMKAKIAGVRDIKQAATLISMMEYSAIPDKERTPEKLMEIYTKNSERLGTITGILQQRMSGVSPQQGTGGLSPVAPPDMPANPDGSSPWTIPPGAAGQESNLRGLKGNVAPEDEERVLQELLAYEAKGAPGSDPAALQKAIEDQKARVAAQRSGQAPQAQPPAQTPTPQASGLGADFKAWKEARDKKKGKQ